MTVAKPSLVITTINSPNEVMRNLATGAAEARWRFIIIGDSKTPTDFTLDHAEYYGLEAQGNTGLAYAALCPTKHYARKNIGYLLAIKARATMIIETDDDNLPLPSFFAPRQANIAAPICQNKGWVNLYRYFCDENIWPRGLPLEEIKSASRPDLFSGLLPGHMNCPIQQGLADDNPDVDALYRLTQPLPVRFAENKRIILAGGSFCPFNSQNTVWWPEAYPLLYLPAFCSFRMTDIWRSFVAIRIAAEYDWGISFHSSTVVQDRNEHNLLRDFEDEIPGYLHNNRIMRCLNELNLSNKIGNIGSNMVLCYQALVEIGVIDLRELPLLAAWLNDLN